MITKYYLLVTTKFKLYLLLLSIFLSSANKWSVLKHTEWWTCSVRNSLWLTIQILTCHSQYSRNIMFYSDYCLRCSQSFHMLMIWESTWPCLPKMVINFFKRPSFLLAAFCFFSFMLTAPYLSQVNWVFVDCSYNCRWYL